MTERPYPKDNRPVFASVHVRYERYKPNSQQARGGIEGRWQEHNGYGWSNTDVEVHNWLYDPDIEGYEPLTKPLSTGDKMLQEIQNIEIRLYKQGWLDADDADWLIRTAKKEWKI